MRATPAPASTAVRALRDSLAAAIDTCLTREFEAYTRSPVGCMPSAVQRRVDRSPDLQKMLKKGAHGFNSQMETRDLGSTQIPFLVLGLGFQDRMGEGLLQASAQSRALINTFSDAVQQAYSQVRVPGTAAAGDTESRGARSPARPPLMSRAASSPPRHPVVAPAIPSAVARCHARAHGMHTTWREQHICHERAASCDACAAPASPRLLSRKQGSPAGGSEDSGHHAAFRSCLVQLFRAEVVTGVEAVRRSLQAQLARQGEKAAVDSAYGAMADECQRQRRKAGSNEARFVAVKAVALAAATALARDVERRILLAYHNAKAIPLALLKAKLPVKEIMDGAALQSRMEAHQSLMTLVRQLLEDGWLPPTSVQAPDAPTRDALRLVEQATAFQTAAKGLLFQMLSPGEVAVRKKRREEELAAPVPGPGRATQAATAPVEPEWRCHCCPTHALDWAKRTRCLTRKLALLELPPGVSMCKPCGDWLYHEVGKVLARHNSAQERVEQLRAALARRTGNAARAAAVLAKRQKMGASTPTDYPACLHPLHSRVVNAPSLAPPKFEQPSLQQPTTSRPLRQALAYSPRAVAESAVAVRVLTHPLRCCAVEEEDGGRQQRRTRPDRRLPPLRSMSVPPVPSRRGLAGETLQRPMQQTIVKSVTGSCLNRSAMSPSASLPILSSTATAGHRRM
ncbi:MAG: hypothetical protein WDW36_005053 [Sanguina aurantia]